MDMYNHETLKLIHSVNYNYNPPAFSNFFKLTTHCYSTRLQQNSKYSLSKPNTEFGKKSLKFSGVKLWLAIPSTLKQLPQQKVFNYEYKKSILTPPT